MANNKIIFILLCISFCLYINLDTCVHSQELPYQDTRLPLDKRVIDLLGRMTLEEKVAQTWSILQSDDKMFDENGTLNREQAHEMLRNGMGQIARLGWGLGVRENVEYTNAMQKYVIENTRLGIPVIFHDEALHGHTAEGGTSFPIPLGLGSTWDPELIEEIFTVVAKEVRSRGGSLVLGPVLDLCLDPRWGRVEETWGEDPYLASQIAVSSIRGLQGNGTTIDSDHVAATLKHFPAHSMPERGLNKAPINLSERFIRMVMLPPFQAAVVDGGVKCVMPCYNDINGIPAHANSKYLDDILRHEWGFEAVIVADYNGILNLATVHQVAADLESAARLALEAGVDMELPAHLCYDSLSELINKGRISERTLDRTVARILRLKFQLGLFEDPYADPDRAVRIVNSEKHRELALEAAHKALILLKNEDKLLPLDSNDLSSIAVIGPNAERIHLGGYSWEPQKGISVLEGIRKKIGNDIDIHYAQGCKITEGEALWWSGTADLVDHEENLELIREAVETAQSSDIVILCVGGNESTTREGWSNDHRGDRTSLDLPGSQNELVKAIVETGTPTIVVLIHGRPMSINYIAENVPAVIEGWYNGQETGTAVADVLFGDYNPGGKLPVTIPQSVGHLPVYYYHKPSLEVDYLYTTAEPLYPFGYGLSYTTFEYNNLAVAPEAVGPAGNASVSVDITNTGKRAGDEIVQMYIRDTVSSLTRPVKELKGFQRISLQPGETKTVTFEITPDKLSFLDEHMEEIVEPGIFEIMVGSNSVELQTVRFEVIQR